MTRCWRNSTAAAGKGCWTACWGRRMPLATTKIWPAKDSLARVVDYAQNPEKTTYLDLRNVLHYAANEEKTVERTERAMFVTGVNCNRDTAFQEMQAVKERFGLQEKKALTAKRRNWTRPNSG